MSEEKKAEEKPKAKTEVVRAKWQLKPEFCSGACVITPGGVVKMVTDDGNTFRMTKEEFDKRYDIKG